MRKAVKNKSEKNMVKNEIKVMCPICGTEVTVAEYEHDVKQATVGDDRGLGNVYLPVNKRGNALKAAGIDTSKYFSIKLPTGGTQMMRMTDEGVPVAVASDDPVMSAIAKQGTVPNRSLFRRWVMSQVFHGLRGGNFTKWLTNHGYRYQWNMLVEELRVQAKLYGKDMENYGARNRWFNKELAELMASDYIDQIRKDANTRPRHKCKGVPYVKIGRQNYFVTDIEKKLIDPVIGRAREIFLANTPYEIYHAVKRFVADAPVMKFEYKQFVGWKDAYKGMGAYATMQNLLRFHGCKFPKNNDFYRRGVSGLRMLDMAASTYYKGEGWRLFGLMKQMLEENDIDIYEKMKQWSDEKAFGMK